MEDKLREYRRRRRVESVKEMMYRRLFATMSNSENKQASPGASPVTVNVEEKSADISRATSESNLSVASSNTSGDWSFSAGTVSRLTLITYFLYALLWVTVFLIAIQLRFGAVYLVLSGLIGIYLNTRTGPKREGEMSAYSVFNPNCEAIDGTLKPEHFERDLNLMKYSPSV